MHIRTKEGWTGVSGNDDAHGVFLVVIKADKHYYFATETIEVELPDTKKVLFRDSLINDMIHTDSVDLYTRAVSGVSFSIQMLAEDFPINDIRNAGVFLQSIKADVYWGIAGDDLDFTLEQCYHILHGPCKNMQYDSTAKLVSFMIEEPALESGKPFPPAVTSSDRISTLNDEQYGKPYPVIFGTVKKSPVIEINGGGGTNFLVACDSIGDFSGVTALYIGDGADQLGGGSTTSQVDDKGTPYVMVTPLAAIMNAGDQRNVVVDVTGHTSATPGDIIRDLIQFYSNVSAKVDFGGLSIVDSDWPTVDYAIVVNSEIPGGALSFARDRIMRTVPIAMFYRGERYKFLSLKWHRHVVKKLTFDKNILRKSSMVTETNIDNTYTSFAAKYDRSGYRGEATALIEKDRESDYGCGITYDRLGFERAYDTLDYGDLTSASGATALLDWVIDLYTKIRVWVSYECTMDVFDVDLLDCVQVDDEDESWTNDPIFRVVGKTYTSGGTIILDLVSVDDCMHVYDINNG